MSEVNENLFFVIIYALVGSSVSQTSKEPICHSNPCGEGTCIQTNDDSSYTCICPLDGFIYTNNCVTENCFPNPCKNNGTCKPLSGTIIYECVCSDGYNGTNCEIDTNLCYPNPCKNGFPCVVKDGEEVCKCQLPYRGDNCEIGPCTKNPCQNGGKCTMYSKVPKCECLSGFYGERCEKDACYLRDVCKNGGTCRPNGFNKFKCDCEPHYYGIFCENEVLNTLETTKPEKITVTNPPDLTNTTIPPRTDIFRKTTQSTCNCGHHSLSCDFNHDRNKICVCEAGFSQLNDVCVDCYCGEKSINCSFGRNLEKKCWCEKGYAQKHGVCKETCNHDVDCLNGGICKLNGSDGFCECHADYIGDRCEISNACKHLEDTCGEYGGICVIHDGWPQCECPPDKEHKDGKCKTICDASKCVHGQCEIVGQSFNCRCFVGYAGKYCEKTSNEQYTELIIIIFAITLPMVAITIIGIVCWLIFNSMKNTVMAQDSEKVNLI